MKRVPSCVAVVVMSVATLSACSGGDGSEYCDKFRENAESNEFDNLGADDIDKIKAELEKFRDIAPEELQDDYDTLIAALGSPPSPFTAAAVKHIQDHAVENCDVEIKNT